MVRTHRAAPAITAAVPGVSARASNLEWLVTHAKDEYDLQIKTLESLDTKAGALVAFVGVLLAFPVALPVWARVAGSVVGIGAGTFALLAFSPKKILSVRALHLTDRHGAAAPSVVKAQTLALLLSAIETNKSAAEDKATRVEIAAGLALVATVAYGAGEVYRAWRG